MRKLISTTALFVLALSLNVAFAQDDDIIEENAPQQIDTTEIDEEHENEVIINLSRRHLNGNLETRWFTLGLGVNPVMSNGDFNFPAQPGLLDDWNLRTGKSTNVDLGIVAQKLNLANHRLYLHYGLGLDLNKFTYENNFFIDENTNQWATTPITEEVKKNRLAVSYLQLPVMLEFNTSDSDRNSFKFSAGGFGGLRMKSNQKIKYKGDVPGPNKIKVKDDFNLNNFIYGLRGELGYGPVNFYTKYHLENILKDSSNPDLNVVSMGIMIVPF